MVDDPELVAGGWQDMRYPVSFGTPGDFSTITRKEWILWKVLKGHMRRLLIAVIFRVIFPVLQAFSNAQKAQTSIVSIPKKSSS